MKTPEKSLHLEKLQYALDYAYVYYLHTLTVDENRRSDAYDIAEDEARDAEEKVLEAEAQHPFDVEAANLINEELGFEDIEDAFAELYRERSDENAEWQTDENAEWQTVDVKRAESERIAAAVGIPDAFTIYITARASCAALARALYASADAAAGAVAHRNCAVADGLDTPASRPDYDATIALALGISDAHEFNAAIASYSKAREAAQNLFVEGVFALDRVGWAFYMERDSGCDAYGASQIHAAFEKLRADRAAYEKALADASADVTDAAAEALRALRRVDDSLDAICWIAQPISVYQIEAAHESFVVDSAESGEDAKREYRNNALGVSGSADAGRTASEDFNAVREVRTLFADACAKLRAARDNYRTAIDAICSDSENTELSIARAAYKATRIFFAKALNASNASADASAVYEVAVNVATEVYNLRPNAEFTAYKAALDAALDARANYETSTRNGRIAYKAALAVHGDDYTRSRDMLAAALQMLDSNGRGLNAEQPDGGIRHIRQTLKDDLDAALDARVNFANTLSVIAESGSNWPADVRATYDAILTEAAIAAAREAPRHYEDSRDLGASSDYCVPDHANV